MAKKFVQPELITGLNGVAGFKINEWLKSHPANKETVNKSKREILKHIKSFYN